MAKFFANERAALGKAASVNAEFKKDNAAFASSAEAQTGTVLEFIPVHCWASQDNLKGILRTSLQNL